jgi:hypothetical protein
MGIVEEFPGKPKQAKKPKLDANQKAWMKHFENLMHQISPPIAMAVLIGVERDLFLESVRTCFDYWERARAEGWWQDENRRH